MRLRKMAKKVADNLLNPQETKKISEWKTKLDNARVSYTDELNRIKRRTELYDGSRKVNGNPNSNRQPSKVAINVRNITYELIESQVDSSIPAPKVIPIHAEDEEAAKVIEAYLSNKIKSLKMEEINDINERTTYIQGGDFFHVEWDSKKGLHSTVGDIEISERHPKQIIPQPGCNDFDKMDYFFIQYNQTKDFVKRKYGINVELAEKDTEYTDDNTPNTENIVTINTAYYRNENNGIGLFIWCDDYILEDMKDYQARQLEYCAKCGKVKDSDICECGSKKFEKRKADFETLTDVIETYSGDIIQPYTEGQEYVTDENGNILLDEQERPIMQLTREVTKIPYYNPSVFPVAERKNVSKIDNLLGYSDVDVIEDQQDAINKIGSKIQEKILAGGSYLILPKATDVDTSDKDYKIIRADQATKDIINVKTTQADISQDMAMFNQNYQIAKSTIGVTDAYQGKYDSSATSGAAKQYQINQAAGRLESKRVMKNVAYAKLYELMFKFALAYADQRIPIASERTDGSKEYLEFDRYKFLKMDDAGEYYWNDEFIFTTNPTSTIMTNREAMWQQIDMKLQSGAFGPVGDLETSLLYWKLMEKNGYPNAGVIRDSLEQRLNEQSQLTQGGVQDAMSNMPVGNGNIVQ